MIFLRCRGVFRLQPNGRASSILSQRSGSQQMVTRLLNLDQVPASPDAADALAIAICHLHTAATKERQGAARC